VTERQWVECIAHYLGLCALIDAQLAQIMDHLQRTGQWDNTVVVFTSDHGDLIGAHGLTEKGHLLHYEQPRGQPGLHDRASRAARTTDRTVGRRRPPRPSCPSVITKSQAGQNDG